MTKNDIGLKVKELYTTSIQPKLDDAKEAAKNVWCNNKNDILTGAGVVAAGALLYDVVQMYHFMHQTLDTLQNYHMVQYMAEIGSLYLPVLESIADKPFSEYAAQAMQTMQNFPSQIAVHTAEGTVFGGIMWPAVKRAYQEAKPSLAPDKTLA